MPRGNLGPVWQHLHRLIDGLPVGDQTDSQLLDRFLCTREESAFESLVRRHGLLVLRVCRRVLSDASAAEDAFQATFLILVRKAGTIRQRQSLSSWLYGVAYRVARKARSQGSRRRMFDADLSELPASEVADDGFAEVRPILDEELLKLADKFRAPLVLCYLEGKTYKEAARELGWSEGSMSRRLAQARERLRNRLLRRGVGLSLVGLTTLLSEDAVAAVPPALTDATVQATTLASSKASVAALVAATLRDLALVKLKLAAATCLALASFGTAGLAIWWSGQGREAEVAARPAAPQAEEIDFTYHVPVVRCEEDLRNQNMNELEPEAEPEPLAVELPSPLRFSVQRRHAQSEAELRQLLRRVPEVSFDPDQTQRLSQSVHERSLQASAEERLQLVPNLLAGRSDLAGLPILRPPYCELEADQARTLRDRSRDLRGIMGEALVYDQAWVLARTLQLNLQKAKVFREDFANECAVPALTQLLQAQEAVVRQVLVEQLARIENRSASEALARLALFDLAPEIRAEAINALSARPSHEYRDVLLAGFRYPWPPAADHAAEALVTLQDQTAVPLLEEMLSDPDPAAPVYDAERRTHVVRELVRVNHLRNCIMCHAPAPNRAGQVIALAPAVGKELPPLSRENYDGREGLFVRAEVTYLRQDFSVTQPVADHGPWPAEQRFDYLVRRRAVPPPIGPPPASWPQREALRYALERLRGSS